MDLFIGVCSQKKECPHEMLWLACLLVRTIFIKMIPDTLAYGPIHSKKGDKISFCSLCDIVVSTLVKAITCTVVHNVQANIFKNSPGEFHFRFIVDDRKDFSLMVVMMILKNDEMFFELLYFFALFF